MINLVLAADGNFAVPLAVTLRSVCRILQRECEVAIHVVDGGMSSVQRDRVDQIASEAANVTIRWIAGDLEAVRTYRVTGHVNFMTYVRLLLPSLLPRSVAKVLYLDCDTMARRCLSHVWELPLSGNLCLAVQDCAATHLDGRVGLSNFDECGAYVVSRMPVPNFEALGLDPSLPYFNAGVMLIDVDGWRREGISEQLLECLRKNRKHIRWWDQYALNVVLARRWGMLDPRWNQQAHIFQYPSWDRSPFEEQTFDSIRNEPYIVHFSSPVKPWHAECCHPYRDDWFRILDQTEWRDWRPPPLNVVQRLYRAGYWRAREMVRLVLRKTQMWMGGRALR